MKNNTLLCMCAIILCFANEKLFSQATVAPGNTQGAVTDFLGWNTIGGANPLNIKTEQNQPINFYTNAGAGALNNFRGVIDSTTGFWGVGTRFPVSVLHVDTITNASAGEIFRTVSTANTQVFWRMFRGGFEYGRIYNRNDNDLYIQAPGGNMRLYAGSSQRVFIEDNGSGAASGYVAIGNGFSNPASRLHVSQGNDQPVFFQMTGNNTNGTAIDGLRIAVLNPAGGPYDVELRQQENASMKFFTGDGATPIVQRERIKLFYGNGGDGVGGWNNTAGVTKTFISHDGSGANFLPPSVAMLNLGNSNPNPSGGQRTWMDVGTYYNWGTDNMYVGLMDSSANRKDAVINWGDDVQLAHDVGYESLKFIFTTCCGTTAANPYNTGTALGLEVARMTGQGTMGIGPTFTTGLSPKARLDIFDDGANHGGFYSTLPQLRLTQTLNANPALGRWTDFTTTTRGDLIIHPDSAGFAKRVGINTTGAPGNTLEINASASTFISPELAGLRFTDLINTVTPITNPTRGVLSVDNDGDVIWVRDSIGTGTGSGDVIACIPLDPIFDNNFITKWTDVGTKEICRTLGIYENPSNANVSIDIPLNYDYPNPGTPFKLTVNGSIAVGDTGRIYKGFTSASGPFYNRIYTCEGGAGSTYSNVSAGVGAGPAPFTASMDQNVHVGYNAGLANAASSNTFIGASAGVAFNSASGTENTFIGFSPAINMLSGSYNLIGAAEAAPTLDNGNHNTLLGFQTALHADTISHCAFLGHISGTGIKSGNTNTMLGYAAGTNIANAQRIHATALGADAKVDIDSTVSLGSLSDYVAIGTASPRDSVRLTVNAHFTPKFHNNAAVFNGRVGIRQYADPVGSPIQLPVDSAVLTVRALFGSGGYNYAGFFVGTNPDSSTLNPTAHALFAGGRVLSTGGYWVPSDANLKTNIQPMGNVQALLDPINSYTYEFASGLNSNLVLPHGTQGGFLANEIAASFPHLVNSAYIPPAMDDLGNITAASMNILTVNTDGLIPYMFKAMKEQKSQIEALTVQQALMQQQLNICCNTSPRTGSEEFPVKQTIDLASSDPILYQNQPNPFDNTTVIRYFISENSKQPKIIFQDETGRVINETTITEMGQGSIQINAASLNSGIYTYSLQIDGKIIDSKKMLKSR